jgi:hypothetical protein
VINGSEYASGSISQRHGSADTDPDPDPHENVMDLQHWFVQRSVRRTSSQRRRKTTSSPFHAPSLTGRLSGLSAFQPCGGNVVFKCEIYVTHLLSYYFTAFPQKYEIQKRSILIQTESESSFVVFYSIFLTVTILLLLYIAMPLAVFFATPLCIWIRVFFSRECTPAIR